MAFALLATVPIANAQVVTAVEYYNASLNHYFVTALQNEIELLDTGAFDGAWQRTVYTFDVWSGVGTGRSAICRYLSETSDTHFYGRPDECDIPADESPLRAGLGTISGIAYQAPGSKRLLGAAKLPFGNDLFYLLVSKP